MCQGNMVTKVDEIVKKYEGVSGSLIPVLHEVQQEFGYLSREVQALVANKLDVPTSKVSGVVSFYSLFSEQAKGDYEIGICMGTACYVRGSAEIVAELEKELGIKMGETTEDLKFSLGLTRCIGACGLAPVLSINDEVYGRLTPAKVKELIKSYQEK